MNGIDDERRRLDEQAQYHQLQIRQAIAEMRSGLPLLRYAAGAAFIGLLYFRLRGRRAPKLLLLGGALFEILQRWQRSQQPASRALPRPQPRREPPQ